MAGRLESADPSVLRIPYLFLVNNIFIQVGCQTKSLSPLPDKLITWGQFLKKSVSPPCRAVSRRLPGRGGLREM